MSTVEYALMVGRAYQTTCDLINQAGMDGDILHISKGLKVTQGREHAMSGSRVGINMPPLSADK